ncbi:PqqD family protein [Candidatus Neomarinimicrobiota bacterium]
MSLHDHYRINSPGVVFEAFDDEVVIINLDSGNYFSFNKVGSAIWEYFVKGHSIPQIIEVVNNIYTGDSTTINQSTMQFFEELINNEIIVPITTDTPTKKDIPISDAVLSQKLPFEEPQLQAYTDMQDLLLLDPIHEVDDGGWPNRDQEITGKQ